MASSDNLEASTSRLSSSSVDTHEITLFEDPVAPTKKRRTRSSAKVTSSTEVADEDLEELLMSVTKAEKTTTKRRAVYSEQFVAQLRPCTDDEMSQLHAVNSLYYLRDKPDIESAGLAHCVLFGKWTKQEDEQLRTNWETATVNCPVEEKHYLLMQNLCSDETMRSMICSFIKDSGFHCKLAENISRTNYCVYLRARKLFHPGNYLGSFSDDELVRLQELHDEFKNDWQHIGQLMGRSGSSCRDKWRTLSSEMAAAYKPWSEEEVSRLNEGVKLYIGKDRKAVKSFSALPWTQVAKHVRTRKWTQCRFKWLMAHEDGRRTHFSLSEKLKLIDEISASNCQRMQDINWTELWKKSFSRQPSPYVLKEYFSRLKKVHIPNYSCLTLKECLNYLKKNVAPVLRKNNHWEHKSDEVENADVRLQSKKSSKKRLMRNEETVLVEVPQQQSSRSLSATPQGHSKKTRHQKRSTSEAPEDQDEQPQSPTSAQRDNTEMLSETHSMDLKPVASLVPGIDNEADDNMLPGDIVLTEVRLRKKHKNKNSVHGNEELQESGSRSNNVESSSLSSPKRKKQRHGEQSKVTELEVNGCQVSTRKKKLKSASEDNVDRMSESEGHVTASQKKKHKERRYNESETEDSQQMDVSSQKKKKDCVNHSANIEEVHAEQSALLGSVRSRSKSPKKIKMKDDIDMHIVCENSHQDEAVEHISSTKKPKCRENSLTPMRPTQTKKRRSSVNDQELSVSETRDCSVLLSSGRKMKKLSADV